MTCYEQQEETSRQTGKRGEERASGGNNQTGRRRRPSVVGAWIHRGLSPCKQNCICFVFCQVRMRPSFWRIVREGVTNRANKSKWTDGLLWKGLCHVFIKKRIQGRAIKTGNLKIEQPSKTMTSAVRYEVSERVRSGPKWQGRHERVKVYSMFVSLGTGRSTVAFRNGLG